MENVTNTSWKNTLKIEVNKDNDMFNVCLTVAIVIGVSHRLIELHDYKLVSIDDIHECNGIVTFTTHITIIICRYVYI